MAILTKEEVAQKLVQLKQYRRDFDVYEARWKASSGSHAKRKNLRM